MYAYIYIFMHIPTYIYIYIYIPTATAGGGGSARTHELRQDIYDLPWGPLCPQQRTFNVHISR